MNRDASALVRLAVVSVRQACVAPPEHVNSGGISVQLAEEQPDSHVDFAIHFVLAGGSRHEMATALEFV